MSSLIPERPLVISPSLASTIGLEEAILLTYLADLSRFRASSESQGSRWYEISASELEVELSFWQIRDIQRICESLRDKGVLLVGSAPVKESGLIRFAFNQSTIAPTERRTRSRGAPEPAPDFRPATLIALNWQPDPDTMQLLAQQGVPQQFADEQVPSFVQYWRERGEARHAWGNRFLKQVLREWLKWQNEQNRKPETAPWEKTSSADPSAMSSDWLPSDDALDILVNQTGVSKSFIEDAVPEFVLYWREKGEVSNTWNARFITHVKRQWARYQHTVENDVDPKPMSADWKPNQDVFDVLRLARIDLEFAREKIPEFIIYWRDRNEVRASWNTTYLQFIKHQWQTAHESVTNQPTRARRLIDDLTDTSWAD